MQGKVKFFNDHSGWGFIQTEEGRDVFVHYSSIEGEGHRSLTEGQSVQFEVVECERGPKAVKVRLS